MSTYYPRSVVGGTFDRFHKGHKKLLDEAFFQSEFVSIGVTTNKLLSSKNFISVIEPFDVRLKYIQEYIVENHLQNRFEIVPIDTIYGTTLAEKNIDALFVTEDTLKTAEIINNKREEKDYPKIHVVVVPFVKSEDGRAISSELIRKGEIDRDGFVYSSLFTNTLRLPHNLRSELRKPIGIITTELVKTISIMENVPMVIAVGDIVSDTLAKEGSPADISIFDFKTRRQSLDKQEQKMLRAISNFGVSCSNAAGMIQNQAVKEVKKSIDNFLLAEDKQTIIIEGEEDLLTLPAILLAPLNAVVVYGQFDTGAVVVQVTEEKKDEIAVLVKQFIQE